MEKLGDVECLVKAHEHLRGRLAADAAIHVRLSPEFVGPVLLPTLGDRVSHEDDVSADHRVRVAVLSNFGQLRVFETITRPDYANPRGGLIDALSFDYEDYVARWNRLWDLLSREAVSACVSLDVRERAPMSSVRYYGFVDPSGGSADSMTLAVGQQP